MRISDWSSDVCSSDLFDDAGVVLAQLESPTEAIAAALLTARARGAIALLNPAPANAPTTRDLLALADVTTPNETEFAGLVSRHVRSEEHTSELQSLMRHSYAVFCLKKQNTTKTINTTNNTPTKEH